VVSLNRLLNRAFQLSRDGKKEDARNLLLVILDKDPYHIMAQMHYLDTFESKKERAQALAALMRKPLRENKKKS